MPLNPSTEQSAPPVTFRRIAEIAGVSQMTVSRALGNRARVAKATRNRILEIARTLGYRPDPEIAKLMHYLRRGVRPRFQSVICGITNWPAGPKPPYFQALLAGAEEQAARRGYGFNVFSLAAEVVSGTNLHRMLRSRGVQGVMLLPQSPPFDLTPLLDWREFSVVAASMSALAPEVTRVAPHHFANTLRLCRELWALGYRRIGLVIDRDQDARVNHAFSAAVVSHATHEAREVLPPLVYTGDLYTALKPWFRRERPDAIVATAEMQVKECARLLGRPINGPVGFASANLDIGPAAEPAIGGIDELPTEIGAIAVDLLASMIERRVRGVPTAQTSTLVAGAWRRGRSCPRRN